MNDTDKARALIAEGLRHDGAMTPGPWSEASGRRQRGAIEVEVGERCYYQVAQASAEAAAALDAPAPDYKSDGSAGRRLTDNAAGIAWLRTHARELLTGYAAALNDKGRLASLVDDWSTSSILHGDECKRLRHELEIAKFDAGKAQQAWAERDALGQDIAAWRRWARDMCTGPGSLRTDDEARQQIQTWLFTLDVENCRLRIANSSLIPDAILAVSEVECLRVERDAARAEVERLQAELDAARTHETDNQKGQRQ